MATTDQDLEKLEEWLDGELPDEPTEELRRRLSSEPSLAEAMDRLRADRQLRSHLFTAFEPSDAEVETLIAEVRRGVRKEEIWAWRARSLRKLTSIAASIVVIFMAGWVSRDRLRTSSVQTKEPTIAVMQPGVPRFRSDNLQLTSAPAADEGQIQYPHQGGLELASAQTAPAVNNSRPIFRVVLPDGRVVFVQPVDISGDSQQPMQGFRLFQGGLQPQPADRSTEPVLINARQAP